jgi:hypothetical protein
VQLGDGPQALQRCVEVARVAQVDQPGLVLQGGCGALMHAISRTCKRELEPGAYIFPQMFYVTTSKLQDIELAWPGCFWSSIA